MKLKRFMIFFNCILFFASCFFIFACSGKECKEIYMEQTNNLVLYKNIDFNTVCGEAIIDGDNVCLNSFIGDLNNPIVLPVGEKSSWEMTIEGTLPSGRFLNSFPTPNNGVFFGYNAFGYGDSDHALYIGIEIDSVPFYYCWNIPEDLISGEHKFVYSFDGTKYYLKIDDNASRSFDNLHFNQTYLVGAGDGIVASKEVSSKISAISGQKYIEMKNIGTDVFKVTSSIKKWVIKTKNTDDYNKQEEHTLAGKRIFQLGSSISYGIYSDGVSFVEQIADITNSEYVKEAVSGTTLAKVSGGTSSYVERFANFDFSDGCDILQTQLSTNDFHSYIAKGTVTANSVRSSSSMDVTTICGAIEYIIAKAKEVSPKTIIAFYSCYIKNTWAEYAEYKNFVNNEMVEIVKKWDIVFVDLFNIPKLNYDNYMADAIHPNEVAYAGLFVPYMINAFCDSLA